MTKNQEIKIIMCLICKHKSYCNKYHKDNYCIIDVNVE